MGAVPSRRILRASDAERDAAVERLRRNGEIGRLTVTEMTERIERALEATTLGQLDELFYDLPPEPSPAPAAVRAPGPSLWRSLPLSSWALRLVVFNAICVAIWVHDGGRGSWPGWVLLVSCLLLARKAVRLARREQRRRARELGRLQER